MNPQSLQRLMAQMSSLVRAAPRRGIGGPNHHHSLQEATAAIQAALARHAPTHAQTDVQTDPQADVIDLVAREAEPADAPHPVPDDAGAFTRGTYTDAFGTRDYKLYTPPQGGSGLPLVVMLHGCQQNADDFAAGTAMNDAARRHGLTVLYPAQSQQVNPSRCWNWFKHNHQARGKGEPALLAGMIRQTIDRSGADPKRVYVAGLSAGGAMAAILGHAYPEVFAAVGVHSGLPSGSARDVESAFAAMRQGGAATPSRPMPPTIVFHGDQDATVHPVNGERVVASSAAAAQRSSERARSINGREYTRHHYRDVSGRNVAEHWVVHGAGHAWSGGRAAGSYTDRRGPDATEEMIRFFLLHSLAER